MFEIFAVIVASVTALILLGLAIHFYNEERKKWNKGICPECNEPWEFVGYDWEGERVYVCKDNKHMCEISFNTIDKRK